MTIYIIISSFIIVALIALSAVLITSLKKKLSLATRHLSDMKNKEVAIEAKVENVKEEMKLITDLYIASDALIHLNSEEYVYKELIKTLSEFYCCNQFILYSLDEEKDLFIKKHCYPATSNFPDTIEYNQMKAPDIINNQTISSTILNSHGKPLYYIKLSGRRIKTAGAYIDSVFTDTDLNVFNIYSKQSSMVLDKIKAYAKMERMALTDSLTGLYNRHYAYMRIKQEVKRANREKYPISILFVDIDKFKSINDTFGHDVGDLALKHLSAILKDVSREYDIAIRWGGEEFVLMLPNTSEEGALALAERLRQRIETSNFQYCKMTASLGISTYPTDNLDIEKVISNADSALYHAKQTGRNRTSIFSQVEHMVSQ